jgi:erythronate-4-phosphate dehydrogenase
MMKILYDDNMPYGDEYFSSLGHAKPFTAGDLKQADLSECEALLVRSTTQVDAAILAQAPKLKFVATATAGFNHLSIDLLEAANIAWYAAGGCNAHAVAEYVVAALYFLGERDGFDLIKKSVAVVGVGNIGTALSAMLRAIDVQVIEYDPPRAQRDKTFRSASFSEVLAADVISLHVPLVLPAHDGNNYPTKHMFDYSVLSNLRAEQILINACRGEVVDNKALLQLFREMPSAMPTIVLDCWENEPTIEVGLIPHLALCTAHIAGHSLEGKARGTDMVYAELCRFLGIVPEHQLLDFLPAFEPDLGFQKMLSNVDLATSSQTIVSQCIRSMYDIENDDSFFRRYMAESASFSEIRRNYPVRREWYALNLSTNHKQAATMLRNLGFTIADERL